MIWEGKLSSIDEFDKTLKISWKWLSNIVFALSRWLHFMEIMNLDIVRHQNVVISKEDFESLKKCATSMYSHGDLQICYKENGALYKILGHNDICVSLWWNLWWMHDPLLVQKNMDHFVCLFVQLMWLEYVCEPIIIIITKLYVNHENQSSALQCFWNSIIIELGEFFINTTWQTWGCIVIKLKKQNES